MLHAICFTPSVDISEGAKLWLHWVHMATGGLAECPGLQYAHMLWMSRQQAQQIQAYAS